LFVDQFCNVVDASEVRDHHPQRDDVFETSLDTLQRLAQMLQAGRRLADQISFSGNGPGCVTRVGNRESKLAGTKRRLQRPQRALIGTGRKSCKG
jgi:hypothetical protein